MSMNRGERRVACPGCIERHQIEAACLLTAFVRRFHAGPGDRGIMVTATLPQGMFDRLCAWQAECEGCENVEAVEADQDCDESEISGWQGL
jgi:hypothetical protein